MQTTENLIVFSKLRHVKELKVIDFMLGRVGWMLEILFFPKDHKSVD